MRWKTPVCLYCLRLGWAQARRERGGYFIFHISRHKLNLVNNGTKAWHTEFSRSKLVTSVIQEAHIFNLCHLIGFVWNINAKEKFSQSWLASLARPFLFLANERRQLSNGDDRSLLLLKDVVCNFRMFECTISSVAQLQVSSCPLCSAADGTSHFTLYT